MAYNQGMLWVNKNNHMLEPRVRRRVSNCFLLLTTIINILLLVLAGKNMIQSLHFCKWAFYKMAIKIFQNSDRIFKTKLCNNIELE